MSENDRVIYILSKITCMDDSDCER